ncbi:hypothetical protein [Sporocytophaga myxococcoides]|uniref:hypothetical protein n=1 Tax=Sporocytophaga myxococcoides TaxID=153721 RepID=UPI0012DF98CA|nr:hypothetical protein [Sporocytophaga myxococcoides]
MRRIRITLFVILGVFILVLLTLLHPYFNGKNRLLSYYHHLVWGDVLKVTVSPSLNIKEVMIVFKDEYQLLKERRPNEYYRSRFRLSYKPINKVIYVNGMQVSEIPYEYGKQILQVIYDGNIVGELWHWQTNGYHSHRYFIDLRLENGVVKYEGYIEGPDAEF